MNTVCDTRACICVTQVRGYVSHTLVYMCDTSACICVTQVRVYVSTQVRVYVSTQVRVYVSHISKYSSYPFKSVHIL